MEEGTFKEPLKYEDSNKNQYSINIDSIKKSLENKKSTINQSNIEDRKKSLANIDDDNYLETMERLDRIKALLSELDEDPDNTITRIQNMMQYRDLLTQIAWYPEYITELENDPDVSDLYIDRLRERPVQLDKKRRDVHNTALASLFNMVNDMKFRRIYGFYNGRIMNPLKEADKYGNTDIRREMTNFILKTLYEIELLSAQDLNYLISATDDSISIDSLKQIRDSLARSSRGYGVKNPLKSDDGSIDFY